MAAPPRPLHLIMSSTPPDQPHRIVMMPVQTPAGPKMMRVAVPIGAPAAPAPPPPPPPTPTMRLLIAEAVVEDVAASVRVTATVDRHSAAFAYRLHVTHMNPAAQPGKQAKPVRTTVCDFPDDDTTSVPTGGHESGATLSSLTSCTTVSFPCGSVLEFVLEAVKGKESVGQEAPPQVVLPSARPGKPAPVSSSKLSKTLVKAKWSAPPAHGSPISRYDLQGTPPGQHLPLATGPSAVDLATLEALYSGTDRTFNVPGVRPGRAFAFRVRAVNEVGVGDWSDVAVLASVPSVPSAPSEVGVIAVHSDALRLGWTTPLEANGYDVDSYTVSMAPAGGSSFSVVAHCEEAQCRVEGLTPDTSYTFRVTASNRAGNSLPSDPVEGATCGRAPGAPAAPTTRLVPGKHGDKRKGLQVTWREVDDAHAYRLHVAVETRAAHLTYTVAYEGPDRVKTLADLRPGLRYSAFIEASNPTGWSPPSDPVSFVAPPDVPGPVTKLTCADATRTTAVLTWRPAPPCGAAVKEHIAELRHVGPAVSGDSLPPPPPLPPVRLVERRRRPAVDLGAVLPFFLHGEPASLPPVASTPPPQAGADDDATFRVGDACDALFSEDGLFYAGVVSEAGDDGFRVTFGEYGNSEWVQEAGMRRRLAPGAECEAVSVEAQAWRAATVVEAGVQAYTVRFGDGSVTALPVGVVRPPGACGEDTPVTDDATTPAASGGAGEDVTLLPSHYETKQEAEKPSWKTALLKKAAPPQQAPRKAPAPAQAATPEAPATPTSPSQPSPRAGAGAAPASPLPIHAVHFDDDWHLVPGASKSKLTLTDLLPGHLYQVRLRAANSEGAGEAVEVAWSTQAGPPTPPSSLSVTVASPTSAAVVVGPVRDPRGAHVTKFVVEAAALQSSRPAACGKPPAFKSVGTVGVSCEGTVSGLRPATRYAFRVLADNGLGASKAAESPLAFALTPGMVPEACGPPLCQILDDVNAAALGADTTQASGLLPGMDAGILVLWDAPESTAPLTAYRLEGKCSAAGLEGKPAATWVTVYTGPMSSFVLGCPVPGAKYEWRVAARNELGWGPLSSSATARPAAVPPSPMAPPAATSVTPSSISVAWEPPEDNGGSALTGYELQRVGNVGDEVPPANPKRAIPVTLVPPSRRSFKVTKLRPGSRHAVRVRALSAAGEGAYSPWVVFATEAVEELPPLPPPRAPTATPTDTQLLLSWVAGVARGCRITEYEVSIAAPDREHVTLACGKALKAAVGMDQVAGTPITVTVRCRGGDVGWGPPSDPLHTTPAPVQAPKPASPPVRKRRRAPAVAVPSAKAVSDALKAAKRAKVPWTARHPRLVQAFIITLAAVATYLALLS